jgi:hypothetical protein
MADLIRMLLLTETQAATCRGTTSLGHALMPRTIVDGIHQGKAALPLAVLSDPAHVNQRLFLLSLDQVNLDPEEAWPPEQEE